MSKLSVSKKGSRSPSPVTVKELNTAKIGTFNKMSIFEVETPTLPELMNDSNLRREEEPLIGAIELEADNEVARLARRTHA